MIGWVVLAIVYAALAAGAGLAVRKLRKEGQR
jgi:hypothetical protein